MRQRPIDREALEAELDALAMLGLGELKARWLELEGVALPKYMRRGLMTLAVAHAIQEAALGGLDRQTARRLDVLVKQVVPTGVKPPPKPNRVRVGTRLIREWQGRVHEVAVTREGFSWNGKTHASLSIIARKITGTRWNGWVFFGLKRNPVSKAKDKSADEPVDQVSHTRASGEPHVTEPIHG